jgi:hypothetical protein
MGLGKMVLGLSMTKAVQKMGRGFPEMTATGMPSKPRAATQSSVFCDMRHCNLMNRTFISPDHNIEALQPVKYDAGLRRGDNMLWMSGLTRSTFPCQKDWVELSKTTGGSGIGKSLGSDLRTSISVGGALISSLKTCFSLLHKL